MAIIAETAKNTREIALARRALDVLREESTALEAGDAPALEDIVRAKERAVAELHRALTYDGPGAAMTALALRDVTLRGMLRQITEVNLENGQYAAMRLAYTRARLGALGHAVQMTRAAAEAPPMYQADGFTGGLHRSRALFGAA